MDVTTYLTTENNAKISNFGAILVSDCVETSYLVRKGGFEPPRCCHRQPLKLVRLPVPPLPR
jgi:hypothetical protein